jgi:endonuclease I
MKRCFILGVALCYSFFVSAQIPAGYYSSADWKEGDELSEALYNIIKGHTEISYGDLWLRYPITDKKTNGEVWDMYSDNPAGAEPYTYLYSVSSDQCGNYSQESDCFNREHSFPKSWFNDASPMYSDLFHVYPTDGYVNGKRGNWPFGEVGSASWTSQNGSKVGSSNYPGYSGTVFEPIDEYKGDFARTYFYMITRYKNITHQWSSDMLSGGAYTSWALKMLYEWDRNDPVSQKEIDRNNAVHDYQHNRNPFIDHNEYVYKIWDDLVGIDAIEETKGEHYIEHNVLHLEHLNNVSVFDLSGRELTRLNNVNSLDMSYLSLGIYVVTLSGYSFKYIVSE